NLIQFLTTSGAGCPAQCGSGWGTTPPTPPAHCRTPQGAPPPGCPAPRRQHGSPLSQGRERDGSACACGASGDAHSVRPGAACRPTGAVLVTVFEVRSLC